jgi:hypothetical protein
MEGGVMGIVIFGAMALYLLISIGVVVLATSYAKRSGKSAKRWGWGAVLVMYLIPFWDWLPTVATHQYYCAKESGFWVYKTLDQWKAENSGMTLTLDGRSTSTQRNEDGYRETHQLNQRFNWVIEHRGVSSVLEVSKRIETLVDTKNNSVLAMFIDFSSGNQRSTGTTKFWRL